MTRGNEIDLIALMKQQIMTSVMEVTAIVTTYGRPALLQRMLRSFESARSLVEKQYPVKLGLRIILNGDDAESEKILSEHLPFDKINNPITPAAARNLLLEKIEGDWVVFIDDDVQLPNDFFINFKKLTDDYPDVDVWGGPNTTPSHSNRQQARNGWMLSSYCITGPVANRYARTGNVLSVGNQFNLTLCNLFIKAKCLKSSVFLPFLKTAEENELIYLLKDNGCKLAASDLLYVSHERRSDTRRFLKQIFYYGYGRGQLFFNVAISKQLIFVIVPLAVGTALVGSFFSPWFFLSWISVVNLSYFLSFKKFDPAAIWLPPAIWVFYVMGLARGIFASVQLVLKKRKNEAIQEISR